MAEYNCDLSEGTFADNGGTDWGSDVLTGPAGLLAATRGTGSAPQLAAGDTLKLSGTGDMSRLVLLDCGSDITGWDIGDSVRNKDGAGDDWTGVVVETNARDVGQSGSAANDLMVVWLADGKNYTDIDADDGVESSGHTVDGTRAKLDGKGQHDTCFQFNKDSGTSNYWWFENIEIDEFTKDTGRAIYFNETGSAGDNSVFVNIYAHHCDRGVQSLGGGWYSYFTNCRFEDNTMDGVYDPPTASIWSGCAFKNNVDGMTVNGTGENTLFGCLFDRNSTYGLDANDNVWPINCVFNGVKGSPAGTGLNWRYNRHVAIIGCRFTYLATGIQVSDAGDGPVLCHQCYLGGNTADTNVSDADQVQGISIDGSSTLTLAGSDTDQGYVDPDNGDFNLASGATYRSVALEID